MEALNIKGMRQSSSANNIMGYRSLLYLGALYVRFIEGSLVLIAACSLRFNCLLYIADCMWEKSVGLSKSSLEWALCSLILLIKGQ